MVKVASKQSSVFFSSNSVSQLLVSLLFVALMCVSKARLESGFYKQHSYSAILWKLGLLKDVNASVKCVKIEFFRRIVNGFAHKP